MAGFHGFRGSKVALHEVVAMGNNWTSRVEGIWLVILANFRWFSGTWYGFVKMDFAWFFDGFRGHLFTVKYVNNSHA